MPQIPSDWRRVPLKHTVEKPIGGDWGSEPAGDPADTLCIRVADFNYAMGGLQSPIPTIRSIDPARRARRLLQSGDLLLEKSGGGDGQPVGRVVLVEREFHRPAVSSNFIARMRPKPGFDPNYLQYVHRSLYARGLTRPAIKQTTGIQNLDVEHYLRLSVPFPPFEQQRRIASFLDAITDRLHRVAEAKMEIVDLLGEKRRSLYAAGVTGQLTGHADVVPHPQLPWIGSIPHRWRVAKLTLVSELGTGHTPNRSESRYWDVSRDIPWLTTGDIEQFRDDRLDVLTTTKQRISQIGLENSAAVLHPRCTVALSRTASVGFSVVMGLDMATSQDFVTWKCSRLLDPRFLLICLRAMRADLVGRLAIGSTHKTIYMRDIESLRIPLPTVSEQRQIVELIKREARQLDELTDLVNRQLPLLTERREALVTAAITGELNPSAHRELAITA